MILDGPIIGKYDETELMCVAKLEIQPKKHVTNNATYAWTFHWGLEL